MSGCSALGASQGGALTQLIALGAADKYLSQNPSITFFRFRYNRYTNFAMEAEPKATLAATNEECNSVCLRCIAVTDPQESRRPGGCKRGDLA